MAEALDDIVISIGLQDNLSKQLKPMLNTVINVATSIQKHFSTMAKHMQVSLASSARSQQATIQAMQQDTQQLSKFAQPVTDGMFNIVRSTEQVKQAMQGIGDSVIRNMANISRSQQATIQAMQQNAQQLSKFAQPVTDGMFNIVRSTGQVKQAMSGVGDAVIRNQAKLKSFSQEFARTHKVIGQTAKGMNKMRGAILGVGLSTMFMGMQMQRWGASALRGLFNVFDNFERNQTKMQGSLTQLNASFQFLKFSIVNALEGTIVEKFILNVVQLFVKLADFFSGNPAFASSLVTLFGALFAVGTAGMLWGQIKLFTNAWGGLFESGGTLTKGMKSAPIVSKFTSIMNTLIKLGTFWLIIQGIQDLSEEDFLGFLSKALTGISYFIPGAIGKVAGAVGIGLMLSDILVSDESTFSAQNIVNTLIAAGVAKKLFGVKGSVVVISAYLLIAGIKSGLFSDAISGIKEGLKIITGDSEAISNLQYFLKDPIKNLGKYSDILKGVAGESNSTETASNKLAAAYKGVDYQLVGGSVVPNTELFFLKLLVLIKTLIKLKTEIIENTIPTYESFDSQTLDNITSVEGFISAVNASIRTTESHHYHYHHNITVNE